MTHSCPFCPTVVKDNDQAIHFDCCNSRIHIKYDKLNYMEYKYLPSVSDPWYCISCRVSVFPLNNLTKLQLFHKGHETISKTKMFISIENTENNTSF